MSQTDKILRELSEPEHMQAIIDSTNNLECDENSKLVLDHQNCFEESTTKCLPKAKCHKALLCLFIKGATVNPNLQNDQVRKTLSDFLRKQNIKVDRLMSLDILEHLSSEGKSIAWIKYECLVTGLVKDLIYAPKTMANEVLTLAKIELSPQIASSLSSFLSSCAKTCREVNKASESDDEVEEKWCEIIDWMGWFMSDKDDI